MILSPDDSLLLAISLFRACEHLEVVSGRSYECIIPIQLNLEEISQKLQSHGLFVSEDVATRRIEFTLPAHFYLNLQEILYASGRRINPPEKFYVREIDYLYQKNNSDIPEKISNYLKAAELFNLLRLVADHEIPLASSVELVFLHRGKLIINSEYTENDLMALHKLKSFETEFITSENHKSQKSTIIKTVLIEIFPSRSNITLSDVLGVFDSFVERVHNTYQLYVSEFSFQKIKEEVEKEKLEFTTKLNKIFSDIQNQLLAVPAAMILVGAQLTDKKGWDYSNLLVWLGALIFAIFMDLLVRNQNHTLDAIKQEIDQQWLQIKGKHMAVSDRFKPIYANLYGRHRHQQILLNVISSLVGLSLIIPTAMLIWYSIPNEFVYKVFSFSLACSIGIIIIMYLKVLIKKPKKDSYKEFV